MSQLLNTSSIETHIETVCVPLDLSSPRSDPRDAVMILQWVEQWLASRKTPIHMVLVTMVPQHGMTPFTNTVTRAVLSATEHVFTPSSLSSLSSSSMSVLPDLNPFDQERVPSTERLLRGFKEKLLHENNKIRSCDCVVQSVSNVKQGLDRILKQYHADTVVFYRPLHKKRSAMVSHIIQDLVGITVILVPTVTADPEC